LLLRRPARSATAARIPRGYGFQVPYAEAIKKQAGIATIAVGLILHPDQAEDILAQGAADLIAIGREALFDPNWPLHAELVLGAEGGEVFGSWPKQYGWWLERREPGLRKLDGLCRSGRCEKRCHYGATLSTAFMFG
jgi:hypothetical protein